MWVKAMYSMGFNVYVWGLYPKKASRGHTTARTDNSIYMYTVKKELSC